MRQINFTTKPITFLSFIQFLQFEVNNRIMVEEESADDFNLLDFPNEVLLRIFKNLNDINLLDVSRVCIRFESIANEAFSRKYNGAAEDRYFKVKAEQLEGIEMELYRPFFKAFGKNMTALNLQLIHFYRPISKYWIYNVIKQYCPHVTHLILNARSRFVSFMEMFELMPTLTHLSIAGADLHGWNSRLYAHLTHFVINLSMRFVRGLTDTTLHELVQSNPQLEHLQLDHCMWPRNPSLALSGTLVKLKSLVLIDPYMNTNEMFHVEFNELESLKVVAKISQTVNILEAFSKGCKKIERLNVCQAFETENHDQAEDEEVQAQQIEKTVKTISSFEKLTLLNVTGFKFPVYAIRTIVQSLPHLVYLSIDFAQKYFGDTLSDDILFIFMDSKALRKFTISNCKNEPYFNLNFNRKFAEIGRNRATDLTFEYHNGNTNIIVSNEKHIENGELRYWIGYEADQSQSKTCFLDLNDKCIEKIAGFLTIWEAGFLYETCKKLKKAVASRISADTFVIDSDIQKAKDWLEIIGDDVKKVRIKDIEADDLFGICSLIREKCANQLKELTISLAVTVVMNAMDLSFPNLEKLILISVYSTYPNILPIIISNSLKLKHLEIGDYHINGIPDDIQSVDRGFFNFNNLTVLKIRRFDAFIAMGLMSLEDSFCEKLEVFTVEEVHGTYESVHVIYEHLIIVAMRFRNLTSLNLIWPGIEMTNIRYLFERCTKLAKLSIGYNYQSSREQLCTMFEKYVKENCKELRTIQLVRSFSERFNENIFEFIVNILPQVQLFCVTYSTNEDGGNMYNTIRFNKLAMRNRHKPY